MGFVNYSALKFPRFSEHRSSFLEVLYRSICSLINAVMKLWIFATVGQNWRVLHANLLKSYSITVFFHKCWAAILKVADGCFWGQLYFGNISEWLLLSDSCKAKFILEILIVSHFTLPRCHVKEERVFMYFFFLGKGAST